MSAAAPPRAGAPQLLRREAPVIAGGIVCVALVVRPETRVFALSNVAVQLVIFGGVACVPAWRTRRMSYVDIAWPWGLVALGVQTLAFSDRSSFAIAVGAIYLLMGARMGLGALKLWRMGEFDEELPRYRYQRLRWRTASFGTERRDLVAEVLVQCGANTGILAVPAALAIGSVGRGLATVSLAGLALWAVSYLLESVADGHKLAFVVASKKAGAKRTCDVGLWRYSRHPNYFFQWMQWNAIVVLCAPAAVDLLGGSTAEIVTAIGLPAASAVMFWCLVFYTGAIPSEHYSVTSRPDYRDYQQRTNRFFPGPRSELVEPAPTP